MKSCFVALVFGAVVGLCGCEWFEYDIELAPEGQELQRTLTVTQHGEPNWEMVGPPDESLLIREQSNKEAATQPDETMSPTELEILTKAYGKAPSEKPGLVWTISGRFTGPMPQDVGGHGSYIPLQTAMGTARAYIERFRGDDDLHGQLERRLEAADKLAALIAGWLSAETKDVPGSQKLRAFLDGPFRKDVKNLSIYMWTAYLLDNPGPQTQDDLPIPGAAAAVDAIVRVCQYAIERGYFSPEDLPAIARHIQKAQVNNDQNAVGKIFQRAVARRMGISDDKPIPRSLAFLRDPSRAGLSLLEYAGTTDEYRDALAEWKGAEDKDIDADLPGPEDFVSGLAGAAMSLPMDLPLPFFPRPSRLRVSLATGTKPLAGNGEWDAKTGRFRWSSPLPARDQQRDGLPTLCYAVWAKPDKEFQKRHFGKVALDGWELVAYCLWRKGLTETEAKEWDGFVASLRPGENLVGKLEGFRFSAEPTAPAPGSSRPWSGQGSGARPRTCSGSSTRACSTTSASRAARSTRSPPRPPPKR